MSRAVLWLGLLPGCIVLGCHTVPANGPPDPLVEEILRQQTAEKKPPPKVAAALLAAAILKEVPLQTPLPQARAVMERHGFSCWSGMAEGSGTYLHCTAWKRRNSYYADRVIVKLFYENRRVVKVEASVDRDAWHPF